MAARERYPQGRLRQRMLITSWIEMLQLRLMEKKHGLVRRTDVHALIDGIGGVVLTHLSGMVARCSSDLVVQRKIDAVAYEVRKEMAKAALEMADKVSEPPLNA